MRAIGHGRRRDMTTAEALQVAKDATPVNAIESDLTDPCGLKPGEAVVVRADDYGRDPIAGRLVAVTRNRIILARDGGELGVIHVHFPRAGYGLARA